MKNFLVTTPIKESFGPSKKNIFLGMWCLIKKTEDLKRYKFINYHWSNKKKFKKDVVYIDKTADRLCKILSKKLNKIHNLNEDYDYWKLLIYPWTHHYVSTMYDRWENIKTFLKLNRKKNITSYQLKMNENSFTPKNHLDFIKNTYKDTWNHLAFIRILKYLNPKEIKIIRKNFKNLDKGSNIKFIEEKKTFSNSIVHFYELLIAKFAFRYNKIILESFSFPTKGFLKISLKNLIIPSLYKYLFKDIGVKEDLDYEQRQTEFKVLNRNKFNDKFFDFLENNLIHDLPISYYENFLMIRKKMLQLANKKKIIISMRSWNYNDQFKICAAELIKKKSQYYTCAHGGGLVGEFIHIKNYIGQISGHIHYDTDSSYNKKSFRLSPTINVIDKREINTKKNETLNIAFLEGNKYSHKLMSSAKAEEGINQISELLGFINNLPNNIKKNLFLRCKQPYQLNIKERFIGKFGKEKFNENWKQNFFDFARSSKLMIVNYPQTAFSSSMYYNIPTILVCDKKFWFFKKKSLKMFKLLKQNKMAFENFSDAQKHIIKNWDKIYYWWNSKNIQDTRKLYLKNFFNIEENWLDRWTNFIFDQKKKVFN